MDNILLIYFSYDLFNLLEINVWVKKEKENVFESDYNLRFIYFSN